MGIVDDAIENGVGDSRLTDHVVPGGNGKLGGDQRGFPAVAFLEDFEQVETLLIGQTMSALCQRRSKSRPLGGAKSGRVIRVLASAARA